VVDAAFVYGLVRLIFKGPAGNFPFMNPDTLRYAGFGSPNQTHIRNYMKKLLMSVLLAAGYLRIAQGQNILVANLASGTIGEYSASGALINPSFISGLSGPAGMAVSGNYLYITEGSGVVAKYTTSGQLVNPALVSGLSLPAGIAVAGNDIFVANSAGPTPTTAVGEYTTSGQTVNPAFITDIENPVGAATDGNYVYVTAFSEGFVGKYSLTGAGSLTFIGGVGNPGGLALDGQGNIYVSGINGVGQLSTASGFGNPNFISGGYNSGSGIALDGNGNLFWADNYGGAGGNVIREYTTSGQLENAAFITGLQNPIAITIIPEPSTRFVILFGIVLSAVCLAQQLKMWSNQSLREPTAVLSGRSFGAKADGASVS
jgi:DNA-binding beta-propeller fold protein YncE